MEKEVTIAYPFSIWDVHSFERYLNKMSEGGLHLKNSNSRLKNAFLLYEKTEGNSRFKYKIWMSRGDIESDSLEKLAKNGWEKIITVSSWFGQRRFLFTIFQGNDAVDGSEKIFFEQLLKIKTIIGNPKTKMILNVLFYLVTWLLFIKIFEANFVASHGFEIGYFDTLAWPFAIFTTTWTGYELIHLFHSLEIDETENDQLELGVKQKKANLLRISRFIVFCGVFFLAYYLRNMK